MATLLKVLINLADIKSAGGVALRVRTSRISFDPSALAVTIKDKTVCLNVLPVTINGKMMINMQDTCFGGAGPIVHAVRVDDKVAIDIKSSRESAHGAAWIIGMKPV